MWWHNTWSECVDLGTKLQNGEHKVIAEIKKIKDVNFRDFTQSWGTLEQGRANDEIQAVKSVLRIIQCLKTVGLWFCNLGADHLRILCDVFNEVKINELHIVSSFRHKTDAETWRQLGILVHQCGLKTLKAWMCNPTAECLERFIQGTNGAQINVLNISYSDTDAEAWSQLGFLVHQCGLKTLMALLCHPTAKGLERFIQGTNGAQFDELYIDADDVDVYHLIGRIVNQCGLKTLHLWFSTSRSLKKLIQGMDGTHLDHMRLNYGYRFPISEVQELLPLINEKLFLMGRIDDKKVVEALQEKLNEDHLRSLTIKYYNGYLKASPMDLPPNLPEVEGLKVDETNGIVQLKWSQLSIPNVSYYIVVETYKDGKAVGGPIITDETSCQLPYLRSETYYSFSVWGYTNDAISRRVAVRWQKTGKLNESHSTPEPSINQNNAERYGALNLEGNELMMTLPANTHINESQHLGTSRNNGATLKDCTGSHAVTSRHPRVEFSMANEDPPVDILRFLAPDTTVVAQTALQRSSDASGIEANSPGKSQPSELGQTLSDWLNTEGQFSMKSPLSENGQQGVIKTVEAANNAAVWNGNMGALQESDNSTHSIGSHEVASRNSQVEFSMANKDPPVDILRFSAPDTTDVAQPVLQRNPAFDVEQFIPFRHAEGNLFFGAATSTAPAVFHPSVHANVQQTYIHQDTSTSVQQQPHQYPDNGTKYNSANQGFQQPVQPVVNNPAPVSQDLQRFDANNSTGATELTQLTTVNPSADYDMGASATNGYLIDQSAVNVYQPTVDQAASFFTDQTHNNDTNAYQPTVGQAATFSMDQTFNNDMNAYQHTAHQAAANSMGQTSNNAMNDHPSNSGQIAANSLDQTSNIESDAVRTRLYKLESLVASFQNMMNMQDEKLKMQNQKMERQDEKMKIQDAKMKEQEETITKLEKKVASLEGAGVSASAGVSQLPFILPMMTKDDVEENENLLEEKENETKLVELLSKVGGTGRVAVWRIMGKLFTDRLAKQYSWTGRKAGKNPLRKLKMKEIIFRTGLMKNVDNEPCEKAVMRWLKNASDREGGRERRNKRKGEKCGAKQTE